MGISRPLISVFVFFFVLSAHHHLSLGDPITCSGIVPMKHRSQMLSISDFGAVGDGTTLNTNAFNAAIDQIRNSKTLARKSSSFNLTSHMTLYLADGAVIKALQDTEKWPLIDPLPSYGRGRERPGPRYISFIHGDGLTDVVITGKNGTIDGAGEPWWNMWRHGTLKYTRPGLIEFKIQVTSSSLMLFFRTPLSGLFILNVVVHHVTILAPTDSPNTDGIDPAVGTSMALYNRPSRDITIRHHRIFLICWNSHRSETSGGIHNITVENITFLWGSPGKVRTGSRSPATRRSPDDQFNTSALGRERHNDQERLGIKVERGMVQGLKDAPFTNLCFSNVTFTGTKGSPIWKCSDVVGAAEKSTHCLP
ncbi:hypothetical protein Bca52824_096603 [Brassica carinata]|uniref:Polygalacturonase n=1 Tax=Brassica carinata TaxID=52824 RepID=A0A8X7NZP3_BRACI|nr:hypothetical protein Bca52824_096603 [Brassica carinata]